VKATKRSSSLGNTNLSKRQKRDSRKLSVWLTKLHSELPNGKKSLGFVRHKFQLQVMGIEGRMFPRPNITKSKPHRYLLDSIKIRLEC
jgi:hypothetical protein